MIDKLTGVLLLDYSIFNGKLNQIDFTNKILINTINQYSYCIADEDPLFKQALQKSDILLPDGMAVVAAVRLLTGQKIVKIAGADLHLHLLEELEKKGGSCFYLGSTENTLSKIKERILSTYPNINIECYSPPYKSEFSEAENQQMLTAINTFRPDVVFVGMTAPKQEKWAFAHKDLLETQIICSIGAVFDFYAGTVKRPSAFWINMRLEWFVRLLKEPKRMWKRYLYYGPIFVGHILKAKIKRS
jgi:N-acetylglucosaminyldiphosphoundecaprenol N-acetyl-beta-D-mannosaminyltransferase